MMWSYKRRIVELPDNQPRGSNSALVQKVTWDNFANLAPQAIDTVQPTEARLCLAFPAIVTNMPRFVTLKLDGAFANITRLARRATNVLVDTTEMPWEAPLTTARDVHVQTMEPACNCPMNRSSVWNVPLAILDLVANCAQTATMAIQLVSLAKYNYAKLVIATETLIQMRSEIVTELRASVRNVSTTLLELIVTNVYLVSPAFVLLKADLTIISFRTLRRSFRFASWPMSRVLLLSQRN